MSNEEIENRILEYGKDKWLPTIGRSYIESYTMYNPVNFSPTTFIYVSLYRLGKYYEFKLKYNDTELENHFKDVVREILKNKETHPYEIKFKFIYLKG